MAFSIRSGYIGLYWKLVSEIMAGKLLKIGFIGGGKMAQAMAKGFISAGM